MTETSKKVVSQVIEKGCVHSISKYPVQRG